VTPEERIQTGEINATHRRTSEKRRAMRFAGAATGEMEFVQVHRHQLPAKEDSCQFCGAVKCKDETENSCCRSGQIVLAPFHDPPQDFKQLFKGQLFLVKVSIFAFTAMGASLAEITRTHQQLANVREDV
jgi:hypothetical protein